MAGDARLRLSTLMRGTLLVPLLIFASGCKNCGVYAAHSAGGVTVGQRWTMPSHRVSSYFCKDAAGTASYRSDCQTAREFSADFTRWGQTYVAEIKEGLVISVGRRSYCIDP